MLGMDISTAGCLCVRATDLALLQLVSTRGSWKVYGASLVQDRYGQKLPSPTSPERTTRAMPASV